MSKSHLTWDVFAQRRPGLSRNLPHPLPGLEWVANAVTLISGERDAVLVDTLLTAEQSQALVDWVSRSGKNLIAVFVTHAHGDHFFGLAPLLERFPHAKALAQPSVAKAMQEHLNPAQIEGFWRRLFPGQILDRLVGAEPLDGDRFELEGEPLIAVDVGHTDTASSSVLHVPSLGLIAAGDVVYNGIHPFLSESDTRSRAQWIASLERLDALKPQAVVCGHKVPENADDPRDIERTRQYLIDFERLNESTSTALDLFEAMLALYPERANPGSLWGGAVAAKRAPA